jgi:hypothetical protein
MESLVDTLEKLKKVLEWNKYVPENVSLNTENNTYYNPALDDYIENLEWNQNGWESPSNNNLLSTYPEYIPSDESIKYLINNGDILEIGSGSGYWSHVINTNGGSCNPTDLHPKHKAYNINVDSYPVTEIDEEFPTTIWCDVEEGKHTIIPDYPNHNILFCHPEGLPWTEEVLDLMNPSQRLILIASWYPSPNATPFFFKKLIDNWTLEEQLPVYSCESAHTGMYIFRKN